MSETPRVDVLAEIICESRGQRTTPTLRERIEEIDKVLFDAGCLVLRATTSKDRTLADDKITEARVRLEMLRSRLT